MWRQGYLNSDWKTLHSFLGCNPIISSLPTHNSSIRVISFRICCFYLISFYSMIRLPKKIFEIHFGYFLESPIFLRSLGQVRTRFLPTIFTITSSLLITHGSYFRIPSKLTRSNLEASFLLIFLNISKKIYSIIYRIAIFRSLIRNLLVV